MNIPNFGTGGIRGIAESEINGKLIGKIASAATTVWHKNRPNQAVLIGYDTRKDSRYYARKAALAITKQGSDAIIFDTPIPVPLLSFSLRQGHYLGGIMITASHNDKRYNGIKLYNCHGSQLIPEETVPIQELLNSNKIPNTNDCGMLHYTGKAEKAAYLTAICRYQPKNPLTIVATPLHGSGKELLTAALQKSGHQVISVPCQEICDGRFATVSAPNPEDKTVFRYGKAIAEKTQADLILALDGDGDRCGCMCRHQEQYRFLNGNEIAAILLSYLLQRDSATLPKNGYIVRSAVSGTLGEKIAAAHGVATRITPTGFKFIGAEAIHSQNGIFLGGYEESYGFLWGKHTADKDGIATAVLLAEAAAFYKKQDKDLINVLEDIFSQFGAETTATEGITFPGNNTDKPAELFLRQLTSAYSQYCKYTCSALFCTLDKNTKIALRPSGTEPKLKVYYLLTGENSRQRLKNAKAFIKKQLDLFYASNIGVER